MRFAGARDHDAPCTRQHGPAHLDRLAVRGAIWEPEPIRRPRSVLLLRLVWKAGLAVAALAILYGALVLT